jgi:branched-subunit amino acid ABC-type transport system permease component
MPTAVIAGTAIVGVSGRVNLSVAVVRPPVDVAAVISGIVPSIIGGIVSSIIGGIVSSVICGIIATVVAIPRSISVGA